jgi:hypothetical protein
MPPIVLGHPREGLQFEEGDVVELQWEPVPDLPDGAYYVPTVAYSHDGAMWIDDIPWLRVDTWTLSQHAYLPKQSDDGLFHWSVRVMCQTGVDPSTGRPVGIALSEPSEMWTFLWTRK